MLGFSALAEVALAAVLLEGSPSNVNTDIEQRGGLVVAQTSQTLFPISRRWLEGVLAAEERRRGYWDELPTLIKLRIQLEEFEAERAELRDFSNHIWAQRRAAELNHLITDT